MRAMRNEVISIPKGSSSRIPFLRQNSLAIEDPIELKRSTKRDVFIHAEAPWIITTPLQEIEMSRAKTVSDTRN